MSEKIFFRTLSGRPLSFALFCLFGLFLYAIDASKLPDFEAYYIMYYDGENLGLKHMGYYNIGLIFQGLGINYQEFRTIVLFIGIAFSVIVLNLRRVGHSDHERRGRLSSLKVGIFLALIFIFLFEYYVIRLRAGISIFFFLLSFCCWQLFKRDKFSKFFRNMTMIATLAISAIIHVETFITIALFVGPAVLWSRYTKFQKLSNYIYFVGCFGAWVVMFWFGIATSLDGRGAELASELNPIRFVFISIVPIALWLLSRSLYSGMKNQALQKKYFPYLYELNYIASAAALFFYYYFSARSGDSGEAIVRVMTLSSFGAILAIALGGITYRNGVAMYIIVINSLFFLNTIYG